MRGITYRPRQSLRSLTGEAGYWAAIRIQATLIRWHDGGLTPVQGGVCRRRRNVQWDHPWSDLEDTDRQRCRSELSGGNSAALLTSHRNHSCRSVMFCLAALLGWNCRCRRQPLDRHVCSVPFQVPQTVSALPPSAPTTLWPPHCTSSWVSHVTSLHLL